MATKSRSELLEDIAQAWAIFQKSPFLKRWNSTSEMIKEINPPNFKGRNLERLQKILEWIEEGGIPPSPKIDRRKFNGKNKISTQQRQEILDLARSLPEGTKLDRSALARSLGVSRQAISDVLKGLKK